MADTQTTTTGAVFIPEVWSIETLRAAEQALVMAPLVKRYDGQVKRGDTLHIPQVSNLTATSKTQGSEVTLQNPTESEKTISITSWYEVSFEIEDILAVQSATNLRTEYTAKAKPTKTGLLKPYLNLGTTETSTLNKSYQGQLQRLSDGGAKAYAIVRTYAKLEA